MAPFTRTSVAAHLRHAFRVAPVLLALLAALSALPRAGAQEGFEAGRQVVVRADGDCLNLRAGATIHAAVINCIADGTLITVSGEQRDADGYAWERVAVDGRNGWMARRYLAAFDGAGEAVTPAPTAVPEPVEPNVLTVPPPGGFAMGPVGAPDIEAFVEAQEFDVSAIWLFRTPTQDYLSYIVGAPAFVNTLDGASLRPGSVVIVRRQGVRGEIAAEPPAEIDVEVEGEANVLPSPPSDGFTIGLAGTNDVETFIAAQPFEVRLVTMLDIPSQQWLTYIPGAPDIVQSLGRGQLQPASVVWVRGGDVSGVVAETVEASLSYYYCNQGTVAVAIGDGGGFCGRMANGEFVHEGAAACARELLGQRFRISGDPNGLTYTCTDTGSAVRGQHRDIWFDNSDDGYRWIVEVGYTAQIEILAGE